MKLLKKNKIKLILFTCASVNNLFTLHFINTNKSLDTINIKHDIQAIETSEYFKIGDAWKEYDKESRYGFILKDNDDVRMASVLHKIRTFHIETNKFFYTLITQELQVTPYYYFMPERSNERDKNWKWWMNSVTFNFEANDINNCVLRDYQPKARNPQETITYISDLSGEIVAGQSGIGVSASVSCSFLTKYECPEVYDRGNMARNYGSINFNFLETKDNKNYLTGRVIQCSSQIYRVRKNTENAKSKVELHYDKNKISLWQNRHDWNWFCNWYTDFPNHQDSPKDYEFQTPKYILVNDNN